MVVLVNSAGWRYENRRCNLYGQLSFSLGPEALMAPLGIRRAIDVSGLRRMCMYVRRLDATPANPVVYCANNYPLGRA